MRPWRARQQSISRESAARGVLNAGRVPDASHTKLQMSTSPAVDIAHLAHRYGEHVAIRDLSFTINEREVFAILGPNGSGKTTLFRVLSTLIPIQQGEVR